MDLDDIDKWSRELLQKEARKRGYINASMYSRPELIRLILRHDYASTKDARQAAFSLFEKAKSAFKLGWDAASHAARSRAHGEALPPGPGTPRTPATGAREAGSARAAADRAPVQREANAPVDRGAAAPVSARDDKHAEPEPAETFDDHRDEPRQAPNFDNPHAEPERAPNFDNQRAEPEQTPNFDNRHAEPERAPNFDNQRTEPGPEASFDDERTEPGGMATHDDERTEPGSEPGFDDERTEPGVMATREPAWAAGFAPEPVIDAGLATSAAHEPAPAAEAARPSSDEPAPRAPARSMFPPPPLADPSSQPQLAEAPTKLPAHIDPSPELRPPALSGTKGEAPPPLELSEALTNAQLTAAATPIAEPRTTSARVDPTPELRPPAKSDFVPNDSGFKLPQSGIVETEYGSSPWSIRPVAPKPTAPADVIAFEQAPPPSASESAKGADQLTYGPRTEHGLLLRWQVSADGVERARAVLGSQGELAVRIVAVRTDDHAVVHTEIFDHGPIESRGDWTAPLPPNAARYVSAVGLRTHERFVSIVHASS